MEVIHWFITAAAVVPTVWLLVRVAAHAWFGAKLHFVKQIERMGDQRHG